MTFVLPRDAVVPVEAVEVRLDPAPHPFEIENAEAIEAYWRKASAENPALFDGRLVLHSDLAYRDRKLVGTCREVRFATFLYWRERRGAQSAEHAYAHAALVSGDNQLVAIRMGKHTANAGSVYFAAGSFEATDFVDGWVDVDANMTREVGEETGLDISTVPRDPGYHLYSRNGGTVIIRRYYLPQTGREIADRIERFVAAESDPEIEGPVLIPSAAALPAGTKPYMAEIVRWHFSQPARHRA